MSAVHKAKPIAVIALVITALWGRVSDGKADPVAEAAKERAKVAYRSGTKHYNLAEYQEALTDFKEAYRAYEEPSLLFNIGQCQRQLGLKLDAIRSYRAFLRETPNVPNREEVEQLISTLEKALHEEQASKSSPPQGTIVPGDSHPPPSPTTVKRTIEIESPPPVPPPATPRTKVPVYKKWWLWTVVGVVVVGTAVGLGVGLTVGSADHFPSATTNAGTIRF
jgi:tetratricopeptide (TPR) repeat protein